jgi:hypothetical protein
MKSDTRIAFSCISFKKNKNTRPNTGPGQRKTAEFSFFLSFFLFSPLPCTLTLEKEKEKEKKKPAKASPSYFAKESGKNCSKKKKKICKAHPIPSRFGVVLP